MLIGQIILVHQHLHSQKQLPNPAGGQCLVATGASTHRDLNSVGLLQVSGGHPRGHLGSSGCRQLLGSCTALLASQQCPWRADFRQQGFCCGCALSPSPPAMALGCQLQVRLHTMTFGGTIKVHGNSMMLQSIVFWPMLPVKDCQGTDGIFPHSCSQLGLPVGDT